MSEPQHKRLARWLYVFGAVLIMTGGIGVAVSLVRSSRCPPQLASLADGVQQTSVAPTSPADSVVADACGLRVVMTLTPGPYFLGELVVADVSLTNSTAITYILDSGSYILDSGCGGAVSVTISGGTAPHFSLPTSHFPNFCGGFGWTTLNPGQVLTYHYFLALPSSGEVTVQPGARFLQTHPGPDGVPEIGPLIRAEHTPLDGHWPSLTLSVAPVAPVDRRITLQHTGTTVQIQAPLSARSSLYYRYTLECSNPINHTQGPVGVLRATGGPGWQSLALPKSLALPVLLEPACGEGDPLLLHVRWSTVHWSYAVGAPGFAIATGEAAGEQG
jgi:hypothetical protein